MLRLLSLPEWSEKNAEAIGECPPYQDIGDAVLAIDALDRIDKKLASLAPSSVASEDLRSQEQGE